MPTAVNKRVLVSKANGRKGGLATAAKYGAEFCQARAEKAGNAVREKYGNDYYKHILQFRKKSGWPKGKPRKPQPISIPGVDVVATITTITSVTSI